MDAAFGFLVAGPIHSLALPRTVVDEHATCAHAQLRPGKSLVTTEASAHFRDLHPHSAVELLETGAWEALGHGFHDISAVTTHQLIVHLDSPPFPPTTNMFVYFPNSSNMLIMQQIATSCWGSWWNQTSPSAAESRTRTFRMNRSSKSVARDRSLSSFRTSGKRDNNSA